MSFGLRSGRTRSSIGVIGNRVRLGSIGFPYCIKSSRCIAGIGATGLIACRSRAGGSPPALKGIATSGGCGCRKREIGSVEFLLTAGRTRTAVGVVRDGVLVDVIEKLNPIFAVVAFRQSTIAAFAIGGYAIRAKTGCTRYIVVFITTGAGRRIRGGSGELVKTKIARNRGVIVRVQGIARNGFLGNAEIPVIGKGLLVRCGMKSVIIPMETGQIGVLFHVVSNLKRNGIPLPHRNGYVQRIFTEGGTEIVFDIHIGGGTGAATAGITQLTGFPYTLI